MRRELADIIHIRKPIIPQAKYKYECLDGKLHPLEIESHQYKLIQIAEHVVFAIDVNNEPFDSYENLNIDEIFMIEAYSRRNRIEWAIANSFDGIYISKQVDIPKCQTRYTISVYMKEEHCSYWILKYAN